MKTDELTISINDSAKALAAMPGKFDMLVTSPPYDNLRSYGGHAWDFKSTANASLSALKPGGIMCWNVGDSVEKDGSESVTSCRQKIYFREIGFVIHDTMIWHKLNFSSPSFNRYHQCFEYIFVLSKGKPKCFNPIKDKENSTAGRIGNLGTNTFMARDGSRSTRTKYITEELGMRHNVWKGKTRGQEEMCEELPHPAMMPKWLVKDLIQSWSNTGDLIGDPFAGSGTVGMCALELGRRAWVNDINPEYEPIIRRYCQGTTPGFAFK